MANLVGASVSGERRTVNNASAASTATDPSTTRPMAGDDENRERKVLKNRSANDNGPGSAATRGPSTAWVPEVALRSAHNPGSVPAAAPKVVNRRRTSWRGSRRDDVRMTMTPTMMSAAAA